MNWHFAYTPYIWPMLACAAFTMLLAIYAWRRRSVPGALPFAIAVLAAVPWAVAAALQLAVADIPAKILLFKFEALWVLVGTTALLCFALDYAGLGRWLNRRTITLLVIPILIQTVLIFTNDATHWIWLSFAFGEYVQPVYGIGSWISTGYGYLLVVLNVFILLWLFVRSPRHRQPVALILLCRMATASSFVFIVNNQNPFAPMDPTILTIAFTSGVWAFALFHFRIFDPIPVARAAVIEQMQDGMLVLDTLQKIVDLNSAAAKILNLPATGLRGHNVAEILPAGAAISAGETQTEISVGAGSALRHYELNRSLLKDRSNVLLGHLLLLHDVTEQRRAQAQLMDQQRALATLKEREQVARELHDELSQELAFINVQAQATRELMAAGQYGQATAHLERLAGMARETYADVRGQISKLSLAILPDEGLVGVLRRFIELFNRMYGIQAELIVTDNQSSISLERTAEAQLLRIIQEAFTNIRKHACAKNVQVYLATDQGCVKLTVADDGVGFDPDGLAGNGESFGMRIMRERAAEIGGSFQVQSEAGGGTRIVVRVPAAADRSKG